MSTLALSGSETTAGGGSRSGLLLRYADLAVLALALPIFILAELPLAGYAVAAAAWIAQHLLLAFADRAAAASLRRGDRRRALGIVGASTLGRLWLVTASILLVGLLADRADGLAAAVLTLVLVTVHLGCLATSKLTEAREAR